MACQPSVNSGVHGANRVGRPAPAERCKCLKPCRLRRGIRRAMLRHMVLGARARSLLVAALLVVSVAYADDPPPYPATVTLTPVTVQDGTAEWVVVKMVPVQKTVEVEVERNGRKVKELQTVTAYVSELKAVRRPVKELSASGVDGKRLTAAVAQVMAAHP